MERLSVESEVANEAVSPKSCGDVAVSDACVLFVPKLRAQCARTI